MVYIRNPNGYGAIINLGKNRRKPWAVRVTVGYENKKQKYKYLSYHEKRQDALLALAQYNENPYDLDANKSTFKDVYDLWKVKAFENLAKTSKNTYTNAYNHCETIYDMKFKELKKVHLQKIIDDTQAPSTKQSLNLLFKRLYRYAMQNDLTHKDYAEYLEVEKQKAKRPKQIFTDEEIKVLWQNKNDDVCEIILILIYTGFRITELLELKKENIFIDDKYMIGGKKTVAGTDRIVPISDKILPFMRRRISEKHLFQSKKGVKLLYDNFLKYHFKPLMDDLGMDHTIHDTRHTFITLANNAKVDKLVLKRIVGHGSNDITDRYTHTDIKVLLNEINKIK